MTELDETLIAAVRESSVGLKPGDVLAVRVRPGLHRDDMRMLRDYGHAVERETGIKVAFVPGEEFAATTVNINVTMNGTDSAKLADEVRRQLLAYRRRDGGGPSLRAG